VSTTRQLPCPHCGKSIEIPLRLFFPSRRHPIHCLACGHISRLPWSAVGIGLVTMLMITVVDLAILKLSGLTKADTFPSILACGLLIFALALISANLSCRICRAQVERLDPDR